MRKFKVILEWDSEGLAYHVTVPALPGCVTHGSTREEVMQSNYHPTYKIKYPTNCRVLPSGTDKLSVLLSSVW